MATRIEQQTIIKYKKQVMMFNVPSSVHRWGEGDIPCFLSSSLDSYLSMTLFSRVQTVLRIGIMECPLPPSDEGTLHPTVDKGQAYQSMFLGMVRLGKMNLCIQNSQSIIFPTKSTVRTFYSFWILHLFQPTLSRYNLQCILM